MQVTAQERVTVSFIRWRMTILSSGVGRSDADHSGATAAAPASAATSVGRTADGVIIAAASAAASVGDAADAVVVTVSAASASASVGDAADAVVITVPAAAESAHTVS